MYILNFTIFILTDSPKSSPRNRPRAVSQREAQAKESTPKHDIVVVADGQTIIKGIEDLTWVLMFYWIYWARWFRIVWFDSLRPSHNFSVMPGRVFLGWTSISKDKDTKTQHSDGGEAWTRGPSVSSQTLYNWATVLPWTSWGKAIKCKACWAFYLFSATSSINSIIQDHECYRRLYLS